MPDEITKKYLARLREPLLLVKNDKKHEAEEVIELIAKDFFAEAPENQNDDLLLFFVTLREFINDCPPARKEDVFNTYNGLIYNLYNKKLGEEPIEL